MPNGRCTIRRVGWLAVATLLLATSAVAAPAPTLQGADRRVSIVEDWIIHWQEEQPEFVGPDGYMQRFAGQSVTRTVQLPPRPETPLQAQRIIAKVTVEPVTTTRAGRDVPNDPWNRLGNVVLVLGERPDVEAEEIELLRFITGYGGEGTFEQDVTDLAPLLCGTRMFRVFLSSFSDEPGWTISCELLYTDDGRGAQAPTYAAPVLMDMHVTADRQTRRATIDVPEGIDQPRLRILSTGHSTDGEGANEFISSAHLLKIDGRTVAKWRPWSEGRGELRELNPWSGRTTINGREIWASDLARSGWNPGCTVEPMYIPALELTPGRHEVELTILGIRPEGPPTPPEPGEPVDEDAVGPHGYWSVSAAVVADAPLNAPDDDD